MTVGILFCDGKRASAHVCCENRCARPFAGQRYRDSTGSGADVPGNRLTVHERKAAFDHQFCLGSRDQDMAIHDKRAPEKFFFAREVGDRFMARASHGKRTKFFSVCRGHERF